MTHELPQLSYDFSALEPHIDAQTMEIHYGKHHAAYVTNLNKALEGYPDLQDKTVEDLVTNLDSLPDAIKTPVKNNAGGHLNHTWFWNWIAPGGNTMPEEITQAINNSFGSVDKFKEDFAKAALGRFGSGWAWLLVNPDKTLVISSTPNQDNPLTEGKKPILGLDVWEHAYYLKYQNRRADYVTAWWNVVNWKNVNVAFMALTK